MTGRGEILGQFFSENLMPLVRLRALRSVYIASERKEFRKGQEFSVLSEDADALIRRKKAEAVGGEAKADISSEAGIAETRRLYEKVVGKRPFHAWSEQTLREKIGTYRTTHMTAQR